MPNPYDPYSRLFYSINMYDYRAAKYYQLCRKLNEQASRILITYFIVFFGYIILSYISYPEVVPTKEYGIALSIMQTPNLGIIINLFTTVWLPKQTMQVRSRGVGYVTNRLAILGIIALIVSLLSFTVSGVHAFASPITYVFISPFYLLISINGVIHE